MYPEKYNGLKLGLWQIKRYKYKKIDFLNKIIDYKARIREYILILEINK